jgi:hypothetical protein
MMAWKKDHGEMGEPLGTWGYAIRLLEVLGFVGGSLAVPLVLRAAPYCEGCQRYMRTRQVGYIPASVPSRRVKKSDAAATASYEAELQQAFGQGKERVDSIQQLAVSSQTAAFQTAISELEAAQKETLKLPIRFSLQLVHCRRCFCGSLVAKQLIGQGQHMKQTECARAELAAEFVRAVCDSRKRA